ncbi:MAG: thioesterase family protein [Bacteroidota bacterium]
MHKDKHFGTAKFYIFALVARIQLEIPDTLPFSCRLPIRVTDLNYAVHLANDKVLSMMHEARAQFFISHGYTEMKAEGASFIMSDTAIVYKSEGFYGQTLRCEVGAGDFSRVAFDLYYRFVIEGEEKVLAEAKTGMVCFDYEKRKVRSLPEALKRKLGAPTSPSNSQPA